MLGCINRKPAEPRAAPSQATSSNSAKPKEIWQSLLDREHVLVGKLWDVRAQAFVEASVLSARAAQSRFVLLGERHDNPDHHRLQARVLASLVAAGRRPAVVFEMLEVEQQPDVERYRASASATAAGFGEALGWANTSWPPFKDYQPIFEVAFSAQLPILAGNLAHAEARGLVKQGLGALPDDRARRLRLDQAFPPALEAPLLEELRASHCGHLPEALLAPMALAQHARDAQMARALLDAPGESSVLIAGAGHARRDRGVPFYLALEAPGATLTSVVWLEVQPGATDPGKYVAESPGSGAGFDFAWFTPRVTDEDPCAAFKKK